MENTNYIELTCTVSPVDPGNDILIAEFSQFPFDSFIETTGGLKAYILKNEWRPSILDEIEILKNDAFQIDIQISEIAQENWNAKWERSFEPILIDGRCCIRAPFHEKAGVEFDIIIEPKMSFGTGHHETTSMMVQHLLDLDLNAKQVLDMGCGTGVLAILAEKKGASKIDAIDIDPWCFENTTENIQRNACSRINPMLGDAGLLVNRDYDLIIANINRNILLNDMNAYVKSLNKSGLLLLSGFYEDDLKLLSDACSEMGLSKGRVLTQNHWCSVQFNF